MTNEKITPEYIVEQSKILTDEELTALIENYGSQEYDEAAYWGEKNSY